MKAEKAKWLLQFIPRDKFIIREFTDGQGKCCAVGHLTRLVSPNKDDYSFYNCSALFAKHAEEASVTKLCYTDATEVTGRHNLARINNYATDQYPQEYPKDRVMALLNDMIEAGY